LSDLKQKFESSAGELEEAQKELADFQTQLPNANQDSDSTAEALIDATSEVEVLRGLVNDLTQQLEMKNRELAETAENPIGPNNELDETKNELTSVMKELNSLNADVDSLTQQLRSTTEELENSQKELIKLKMGSEKPIVQNDKQLEELLRPSREKILEKQKKPKGKSSWGRFFSHQTIMHS